MILTITGHRPPKLGGYETPNAVYDAVMRAIDESLMLLRPEMLITGMALGVDQWAAELCLRNDIPYTAAVPFNGFSYNWPEKSQRQYARLLDRAAHVVYTTEGRPAYHPSLLELRNQWMVRHCDAVLAVWDGSSGGTANCVRFAKRAGKQVYYVQLAPEIWAMAKNTKNILDTIHEQREAQRQALDEVRADRAREMEAALRRRRESELKVFKSAESAASRIAEEREARAREREQRVREEEERRRQEREAREQEHRERMRRAAEEEERRQQEAERRRAAVLQAKAAILAAEKRKKEEAERPDPDSLRPRRVLDID